MDGMTQPAPNANPDCPNSPDYTLCRVTVTSGLREPMIAWAPIYDGTGRMVNADPNTHVSTFSCVTCAEAWEVAVIAGQPPTMRMLTPKQPLPRRPATEA